MNHEPDFAQIYIFHFKLNMTSYKVIFFIQSYKTFFITYIALT